MSARIVKAVFVLYKYVIGPALHALWGPGASCRFEPSCSCYSKEAFELHPPITALRLSVTRVLRCNPWTRADVCDPVPRPALKRAHLKKGIELRMENS